MARRSNSDSGGMLFKTGVFALLAAAAFWIFNQFSGKKTDTPDAPPTAQTEIPEKADNESPIIAGSVQPDLFPAYDPGTLVQHAYFALSYSEDHEQAAWVAYELTRDRLNENWAERPQTFRPDPDVRTESATPRDYNSSGYDRGHLCPAADMAFSEKAIDETFFMSNISPQVSGFNVGIWRELEELTRDWARKFKHLYVVTGPVLSEKNLGQIGFSKVTVPAAFYKVLLTADGQRAIAFIVPNKVSDDPVMKYACTIDEVEEKTGIDFFPKKLKGLGEELEGSFDRDAWPVNERRYETRVKQWNR